MKIKIVTLATMMMVLCGVSPAVIALGGSNANPEASAARVPLEHYLKAHVTGDGALIHKAFHPTAKIMSFRDGRLNALTVDEFAARFTGKPASDEAHARAASSPSAWPATRWPPR